MNCLWDVRCVWSMWTKMTNKQDSRDTFSILVDVPMQLESQKKESNILLKWFNRGIDTILIRLINLVKY